MGFLRNLFNRKKGNDQLEETVQPVSESKLSDGIHIEDDAQRERVIRINLDKIDAATKELDRIEVEYRFVTSQLKDCDEIDSFPELEKEDVISAAKKIVQLGNDRISFKKNPGKLTKEQFSQMEKIEEYMPEGYINMAEAEDYQSKIKQDLKRLDGEKKAYYYREDELEAAVLNAKGMAKIILVALFICLALLFILKYALSMDIQLGVLLAIAVSAIAITLFFCRFTDYTKEKGKVERNINKITILQNRVKIRYVNNVNLMEYLYLKYGVHSSKELKKLWDYYEEESEERVRFERTKYELEDLYKQLLYILNHNKISDASVWLHQVAALIDPREMVEVRHNLNLRRQKLREQMEYNELVAKESQEEIKELVEEYPKYAKEILKIVEEYENIARKG